MNPHEIVKRVIGISIDPAYPDDVYGAIEVGGLIKSGDGGETWSCITDGHYTRLGPVDLHGVQVNPTAPGLVYIITQLAMFRSRQRGKDWEFVPIEEMFEGGSYCRDLVVDPSEPSRMYLAAGAGGGSAPAGTVDAGVLVRSTDAGETWERVDLGETAPARMFQIAIDRNAPGNVYCCDRDGHVYCSNDGGARVDAHGHSRSDVPGASCLSDGGGLAGRRPDFCAIPAGLCSGGNGARALRFRSEPIERMPGQPKPCHPKPGYCRNRAIVETGLPLEGTLPCHPIRCGLPLTA